MSARRSFLSLVPCLAFLAGADSAKDNSKRLADQEALEPLQMLVGQWRGVAQPQRGSNRGAWIEESDWSWRFADGGASLEFTAPQSKSLTGGVLAPTQNEGEFALAAKTASGQPAKYVGRISEDGALVLDAENGPKEAPSRVTVRVVAEGKRLVILLERGSGGSDRLMRLAEVGYTRKGSGFGQGSSQIECVVTGGLGTIPVTHEGKTYYVCCTGCRDLFNDDPAGVLAEYRERKEEERKKRETSQE
jgi:hypothetical protein